MPWSTCKGPSPTSFNSIVLSALSLFLVCYVARVVMGLDGSGKTTFIDTLTKAAKSNGTGDDSGTRQPGVKQKMLPPAPTQKPSTSTLKYAEPALLVNLSSIAICCCDASPLVVAIVELVPCLRV